MSSDDTVMALDVGDVRIGVAIASMIAKLPQPLVTISNNHAVFQKLQELITEHNIGHIVIGLPRNLNSQETTQTKRARDFAKRLRQEIALPISLQDEAVTSVVAEEMLRTSKKRYTKEDIDMHAAAYILQDYLEEVGGREWVRKRTQLFQNLAGG